MKKSLLTLLLSGCLGVSLAQSSKTRTEKDYRNTPYWIEMMQDPTANFFETQKAFYTYWKGRKIQKGGGYKPFKRWEHFMAQQVDEKGNRPQATQILNEITTVQNLGSVESSVGSQWEEVGPIDLPTNGTGQPNGLGRVNAIGFHPTNSNVFYVGAPAGGLWKTTDGGNNWSSSTDGLATLGVSSIVVDHTNPSTVYFGSGDRDGNDSPGLGVFKSTDGGASWTQSNSGMGNRIVGDLLMDPNDNSILIAATSGGIYRSTNSGATWTQSIYNNFKDVKFHPTNSSIVYAIAGGNFYKSTDNGVSFSLAMGGIPTGKSRLVIGVTPASPDVVYVLAAQGSVYGGLFKSTNSGTSFTSQSTTPNIMDYSTNGSGTSGQAWYDMCIAVSPTNANDVYVGGVNVFKSSNSGVNWSINAHWVGSGGVSAVHADQHVLKYSPTGKLYSGNDGGVYHKSTSNENWTDISSGLAISQCYKIGQSQTDVNRVIVGYQDNGTGVFDNSTWRTEIGGDGMESAIDYTNSAYMYGELYYGAIRRSTNNGYSFSNIAGNGVNGITESGAWVTPYVLHESNPNTMFIGYQDIWRSTNVKASSTGSVNWTEISSNLGGGGKFSFLEHNEANGNILYAAKGSSLFKSENVMASSVNWTSLSVPGSGSILSIETNSLNENIVYLSRGSRIYQSNDKGINWTDITSNITNNQNKTSLVYAPMSVGKGLYVATDYGVFFKPENESDWITYSSGLPNYAKIKEIELYEDQSGNGNHKIRAASYGRGLWSNSIYITGETVSIDLTNSNVCLGSSITLTGENASSYFWTNSSGVVLSNSASLSVSPSTTSVYTCNGIMASGDTTQAYATVNVLNPSVEIQGLNTVCLGESMTLTASVTGAGSYTYLWSNGASGASIQISPNSTTSYSVTATSIEGCATTASKTVNITNSSDFLVVELKTDNYPTETSWTLTGNSGNVYLSKQQGSYTSTNTIYYDTINCVTDPCLVFAIADSYGDGICCSYGQGYYKIFQGNGTLLSSGGNFNSNTTENFCLEITTPVLTVTDSVITACANETVTYTASGADTYSWQDLFGVELSTSETFTVSSENSQNYTLVATIAGVTHTQNIELIIENINVSINGSTQYCEGDMVTLNASGANNYTWINQNTSTSGSTLNFVAESSTSISLIGESINGCLDTTTVNIVVVPSPEIEVTNDNSACLGEQITITASGADSYLWSTGETTSSIVIENSVTTNTTSVWVIGTSTNCSSDTSFIPLIWETNPVVQIIGNTEYCEGDQVQLTAIGANSYSWSTGETTASISFVATSDTLISVTGMNNSGCTSNSSSSIQVNSTPNFTISGDTNVCEGDMVILNASGADSYSWSNGLTGNQVEFLATDMELTVTGTTNGCSTVQTVTINAIDGFDVIITGETNVCTDDSIVLTANGADTYEWSNGEIGSSITLYHSSTTPNTISVTGFSNGCSTISSTTQLNWITSPLVSITGNTILCSGDTSYLEATGADSYLWSTGETTSTIAIAPSSSTTITVEGITNGCSSSGNFSQLITVHEIPTIEITGDTEYCMGDLVSLEAIGGDSYTWSTGSTNSTLEFTAVQNEIISVIGELNGCSFETEISIHVNDNPIVTISGNIPTCSDETITLTASGADSYEWSTGETTPSITITNTTSVLVNSLSVIGVTNSCTSDLAFAQLTWLDKPTIVISGDTNVCSGDLVTLEASGADSYLWSNGETTSSITFTANTNTTLSVQGFSNGCSSNNEDISIHVNPTPDVTISGLSEVCEGELITLEANGADSYLWSTGETTSTIQFIGTQNSVISVTGSSNGCQSVQEHISVTVIPLPTIIISGNLSVCQGELVTLTASGADNYVWSNGLIGETIEFIANSNETIMAEGTVNGCSSISDVDIIVHEIPTVLISGTSSEICLGDQVTLTAIVNGTSSTGSFLWSTGETTSSIQVSPQISENITLNYSNNGCSTETAEWLINVTETPNVVITGNTNVCLGDSVTLTATGATSYIWSSGETSSSITFSANSTQTYSVTGHNGNCSSSINHTVDVISTPTVTITGNTDVCNGEMVTLTAQGADSYLWSTGEVTPSISLTILDTTHISVEGFVSSCSSSSDDITIIPNSNSSYFVIEIRTDWYGYETTWNLDDAQGNSVASHSISNGGYYQNNTTYLDTVYCALIGDCYTFEIKDSYGDGICCNYGQGYYKIYQNDGTVLAEGGSFNYVEEKSFCIEEPIFAISISNNQMTVCENEMVNMSASGADSYIWMDESGSIVSQGSEMNMQINESSEYTVIGMTNTDTAAESVSITVETVDLYITGQTELCKGESTTLTANGSSQYMWSNGQTGSSINVSPTETTTYTVTSTSVNGCEYSESITVNVINSHSAKIVIKTDWYGYETSWKLKDSQGNIIASKNMYSYQNNTVYTHLVECLVDECYTLEVKDSYGDGMCCSYGYGYFKVYDENNQLLANGGQFNYQTSSDICFNGAAIPELPYEDMLDNETAFSSKIDISQSKDLSKIQVYPNPTKGEININALSSEYSLDGYEITDMTGRILIEKKYTKPFKSEMVNISSFSTGYYLVKLYVDNKIKMVKISKE